MVRRVLVVLANILLVCAMIFHVAVAYQRGGIISAPKWIVGIYALYYVPGLVVVNVANGIYVRKKAGKSISAYLGMVCLILLSLVLSVFGILAGW